MGRTENPKTRECGSSKPHGEQWKNPTVVDDFSGRNLAEREGFEPPVGISYARFPGVCLKPLSHLSASKDRNHARGDGSIAMDFHTFPTSHFSGTFYARENATAGSDRSEH